VRRSVEALNFCGVDRACPHLSIAEVTNTQGRSFFTIIFSLGATTMLQRIARLLWRIDQRDAYMDALREMQSQKRSEARLAARKGWPSWLPTRRKEPAKARQGPQG
jgi:hypothetical protein